jgi:hypothetical protein
MYRTIVTSAAVAVAALAIVAGASAATKTKTAPVACLYAMPTSRAQAIACSSRDVNAPLSPAVLEGIRKAHAAAKGQGLSLDVRQEIYDANQRIAAAVPAVEPNGLPLSEKARQAIYDANHRESESLPTTASDSPPYLQEGLDPAIAESLRDQQAQRNALDPAIATAIAAKEPASAPLLEGGVDSVAQQIRDAQAAVRAAAAPSVSNDPGFNWGSAGIGAVAGALLLIAAVGSGALVRRRRQLLHA